jgi:hypothetical protein
MKTVRSVLKPAIFAAALSCVLLPGCVSERQYRTETRPAEYNANSTNVSRAMIEVASNYTVGYVEFDDQGWLYGDKDKSKRQQIDTVLDCFRDAGKSNGLLMVVFVHGWKHNAAGNDSYVQMFHKILGEIANTDHALSTNQLDRPRKKVVGLYVGWRGLSADIEPFEEMSFWDRKNTAEVVGHGAAIELLSRLEDLRNEINLKFEDDVAHHKRTSTKLLILGHSFGGDIVFSAVSPVLMERMVENHDGAGVAQSPKTLGDLVVLINPAFEAARFEPLQQLAATKNLPGNTNCNLAVFTSTADWATGLAFPIGRRISTLFETYVDKQQAKANVIAVGHYAPYISYNLKPRGKNPEPQTTAARADDTSPQGSAMNILSLKEQVLRVSRMTNASAGDATYNFPRCQLAATNHWVHNDPIFNVAVDPAIIPDHDTIDRDIFIHFLVQFLFVFSSGGEK